MELVHLFFFFMEILIFCHSVISWHFSWNRFLHTLPVALYKPIKNLSTCIQQTLYPYFCPHWTLWTSENFIACSSVILPKNKIKKLNKSKVRSFWKVFVVQIFKKILELVAWWFFGFFAFFFLFFLKGSFIFTLISCLKRWPIKLRKVWYETFFFKISDINNRRI